MEQRHNRLETMLRELGQALSDAISESPEVYQQLRKIRNEGYSLQLLLDCNRQAAEDDLDLEPAEVAPETEAAATVEAVVDAEVSPGPRHRVSDDPEAGTFRINAGDLFFLRSIGIDPTRHLRRRRGR